MGRRRYPLRFKCLDPECREFSYSEADTARERDSAYEWQKKFPYACWRHRAPNEVLSMEMRETSKTITAGNCDGKYGFLTWEGGGSGLVSGPGFRAHAEDFPAGTTLTVTTRINLPNEEA